MAPSGDKSGFDRAQDLSDPAPVPASVSSSTLRGFWVKEMFSSSVPVSAHIPEAKQALMFLMDQSLAKHLRNGLCGLRKPS